ncbi:MAG: signal peptide peptidase SppA [Megasphaera sp.]|jgi:protease-4|uniref:signal peptide peptidase SppA n=1 Tax=Megasphaera sueciensis TaxID=349094 RepID=UPI003D08A0B2|nr:signal peptide peptidase SppA [Megasphaera sp.]MCI1822523.1 signal peptide peptidase SppA [Megasphaera sp.]
MERKQKITITAAAVAIIVAVVCFAGFYTKAGPVHQLAEKGKVAVIRVNGPIVGGDDDPMRFSSSNVTTSGSLMREFRKARKDQEVKAVLLRIDSPGGSAAATQEAATELERLKKSGKPVIVSMGDTAASGAYWLSVYGDTVYANPSTITGSIGVYMSYYDLQGLSQKLGVSEEKIKSGAHKDIFSPFRPMTEEERQMTQTMVNDMYDQFVAVVATGRHMDEAKVRTLADGRVFTGAQAKQLGLVDKVGNYYDALADAGNRIGVNPDDVPTVEYDHSISWKQLLEGNSSLSQFIRSQFSTDTAVPLPLLLMKGVLQR